jgi:hypothetical protein
MGVSVAESTSPEVKVGVVGEFGGAGFEVGVEKLHAVERIKKTKR